MTFNTINLSEAKNQIPGMRSGGFTLNQGSAAGEVQRVEFAIPCDMRKSHVALAGLNH